MPISTPNYVPLAVNSYILFTLRDGGPEEGELRTTKDTQLLSSLHFYEILFTGACVELFRTIGSSCLNLDQQLRC